MKCQRASKNLTAFLDGELPEAFREKIREHVESCPDCQRERAALERVRQSLDLMEAPTLSEGVSPDAILEREARPGQAFREERNGLRAGRWFPNIRVWQPAAALAVVLVARCLAGLAAVQGVSPTLGPGDLHGREDGPVRKPGPDPEPVPAGGGEAGEYRGRRKELTVWRGEQRPTAICGA